jgi:hypothetical protein
MSHLKEKFELAVTGSKCMRCAKIQTAEKIN